MFLIIYYTMLLEVFAQKNSLPNYERQLAPNSFKVTLDEQIKSIIQIGNHNNFEFNLQVFAEMKNEEYIMYNVKITQIMENNLFEPMFEIENQISFIPKNKNNEKCFGYFIELNETIIPCLQINELRFYSLNDQENYEIYGLNYSDNIETIEIKSESIYIYIYINLQQSNWQILVCELRFNDKTEERNIQIISQSDIKSNQLVKKTILISYNELYLLTTNNLLFLILLGTNEYWMTNQQDQSILDIQRSIKKQLVILRRLDDICSVGTINFDCCSNNLQLILFDSQDFYLIENSKQIISPFTNITIPIDQQKYHNKGKDDNYNLPLYQNNIYDYEYDNAFLNQTHVLIFGDSSNQKFQIVPYKSNSLFSLNVFDDQFQLINSIDDPQNYITCLNGTQNYQFIKMGVLQSFHNIFIYQYQNEVYYLNCDQNSIYIHTLIRNFNSLVINQQLYIFFDDLEGKELHIYNLPQFNFTTENNLKDYYFFKFEKQIKMIQNQFRSIIIQHIDNSLSLIPDQNYLIVFQFYEKTQLERCLFITVVNKYLLCAYNTIQQQYIAQIFISDGILELLLIESEKVYQINRYKIHIYLIIDLAMIQEYELIVIMKNNLNQVTYLYQYQIYNTKFYLTRNILKDIFEPLTFEDKSCSIISISALNNDGESYLLVFNFALDISKQFLKYIPYPKNVFYIQRDFICILSKKNGENNQFGWFIELYEFDLFFLNIQTIHQQQYKQNYTVSMQIDNLLNQRNIIELHFVGFDYTGLLYQKETTLPIKAQYSFQKINLNNLPKQLQTQLNHSLQNTVQSELSSIKAAIIVGNQLFFQQEGNHYVSELENDFKIKLTNIQTRNQMFINYGILKSPDTTIAVIYSNSMDCHLKIDIYKLEKGKVTSIQNNIELKICSKKIKIKNNIFLLIEKYQLQVYQYNFLINQFEMIAIPQPKDLPLSFFDFDSFENSVFLIGVKDTFIQIIQIDLIKKLVVFYFIINTKNTQSQFKYDLTSVLLSNIQQLVNIKFQIVFNHLFFNIIQITAIVLSYIWQANANILNIQFSQSKMEKLNIQELIIDKSVLQIVPIFYNEKIILFNSILMERQRIQRYTLLFFLDEEEDYSFIQARFYSANYILHAYENTFIFINSTSIGQIEINNFYEIQVNASEFELEVSNMRNAITMKMKSEFIINSKYYIEIQFLIISFWLTILVLFLLPYWRRSKVKYINLY